MSLYARITGTGSFLPEKVLTNRDMVAILDTSDAWIRERTGIRKRHIVAEGERCSRLAEVAARRALEDAGIGPAQIDFILVATATPDQLTPSTACLLQQRLGIHGCCAFDVQAACAGFVYTLGVADRFIRTGGARCKPNESRYLKMKGTELFKVAVTTLCGSVEETLTANGMGKSDLDWLVPHQANIRIIQAVARKLALPPDRVVTTIDEHANTSAASIPLAFDVAVRDGRIRRGETVLIEGFGSGFTWGSVLLVY